VAIREILVAEKEA